MLLRSYVLTYLPALWTGYPEDHLCLTLGGLTVDWSFFAVFAALLIFIPTHTGIKIPKWFFYAFYPVHLAVIAILQFVL